MNRMAKQVMQTHLLRGAAIQTSALFLTLFLWKTVSLEAVALFWGVHFGLLPFFYLIIGKIVKKQSRILPMQVGLAFAALFFFLLFTLKEESVKFLIPLAMLFSFQSSLHWLPFNTLAFDSNDPGTRGKFFGTMRALSRVIRFIAPIVGGLLIVWDPFGIDYMLVFGLSFLFFVLTFISSLSITTVPAIKVKSDFDFIKGVRLFFQNQDYRRTFFAVLMKGFSYRGPTEKILFLLFFIVTGNEAQTGGLAGVLALIAAASALWMSRQKETKHMNYAWFGAFGYVLATVVFVLWPNFWSLIFFSVLIYLLDAFVDVPQLTIGQNVINKYKDLEYRVEYLIVREFSIATGRVLGYGVLFIVATIAFDSLLLRGLLLAMSGGVFLLVWSLSKIHFPKHLAHLPSN